MWRIKGSISIQAFVHDSVTSIGNEETFLQSRPHSRWYYTAMCQISDQCFIGTTYIVIAIASSNLQPHKSVSTGIKLFTLSRRAERSTEETFLRDFLGNL